MSPRLPFVLAAFSDVYGHLRKASFDQDSATRLVQDYEAYMLQQVSTALYRRFVSQGME